MNSSQALATSTIVAVLALACSSSTETPNSGGSTAGAAGSTAGAGGSSAGSSGSTGGTAGSTAGAAGSTAGAAGSTAGAAGSTAGAAGSTAGAAGSTAGAAGSTGGSSGNPGSPSSILQWGSNTGDWGNDAAVDNNGNVFVTGATYGDMGGAHKGQSDVFVSKVSPNGMVVWTAQLGTMAAEGGRAIALDSAGNAYVAGTTYGSLPGHDNPMPGYGDAFVLKYDPAGNLTWSGTWAVPSDEYVYDIAVAGNDECYVVGRSDDDLFLVRFGSNGAVVWDDVWGTSDFDEAIGVAASDGVIAVAGLVSGDIDGASGFGDADSFVSTYTPQGTRTATALLGTSDYDAALGVALHEGPSGREVFLTGLTWATLPGQSNAGQADVFVAGYDAALVPKFSVQFGTSEYEQGSSIDVDGQGRLYVTGETAGEFEPSTVGEGDVFAARLSSGGALDWVMQVGTPAEEWGNAVDASGSNVVVVGTTFGTLGSTSQGENDVFLMWLP